MDKKDRLVNSLELFIKLFSLNFVAIKDNGAFTKEFFKNKQSNIDIVTNIAGSRGEDKTYFRDVFQVKIKYEFIIFSMANVSVVPNVNCAVEHLLF